LPAELASGLQPQLSPAAGLFAGCASVTTVLLFGLFPALRTTRIEPALAMKGQAPQTLGGRNSERLRSMLATAQIALSMVLLVLAGLCTQSLLNIARVDLGLEVESLASFRVAPRLNGYTQERTNDIFDRIEAALLAQPGVAAATAAAVPLIASDALYTMVSMPGYEATGEPIMPGFPANGAALNTVGAGFFETFSIPLLTGRTFGLEDSAGSPNVAVVNERFVRQFGLGNEALGKRFNAGRDSDIEIVGVVADTAYSDVKNPAPPKIFRPREQANGLGELGFYVRSTIDPDAMLQTLARVVAQIDPTLPVTNLVTMQRQLAENVFLDRLVTLLSSAFAVLATLLAAIGLYGVLAYNVGQRTRELGLRLALGAAPTSLRLMVLKQVGWMAAIGIGIGVVAALALGRVAETLLFGLSARDPAVLAGAAAVLAAVVLAASYVPTRRASTIAPMEALRHE
jgi:predicted permease